MDDPHIPFAEDRQHQANKLGWICVQLVILSYSAFLARDRYHGVYHYISSQQPGKADADIAPQFFAFMASLVSWCFIGVSLVVQIMAYENLRVCTISIWICCTMYFLAKFFLYALMIEKVRLGHLVVAKVQNASSFWPYFLDISLLPRSRMDDTLYKCNWILICLYPVVLLDMLLTKKAEIDKDSGKCLIGLPYISSLPLLTTDVFYTAWLTWLFYRALTYTKDPTLKRMARKNLYAAIVSVIFTEANLSSFVIAANGLLPVHLCFGMCTLDIAANVTVVDRLMSPVKKCEDGHSSRHISHDSTRHMSHDSSF